MSKTTIIYQAYYYQRPLRDSQSAFMELTTPAWRWDRARLRDFIAKALPRRTESRLCRVAIILVLVTDVPIRADGKGIPIVLDHLAQGVIVVPDDASIQNRKTAALLSEYIAESTAATLEVVQESKIPLQGSRIYVGRTRFAEQFSLRLSELDADGFVIHPVDEQNLVIAGATDWGTEFGVCEFLEELVGVRWLLPGEDGTHVPEQSEILGPEESIRQEPASISRFMSGFPNVVQNEWARRNRMRSRIGFHHNLLHLFPAEKYVKTHPHFFPIQNGKRYLPGQGVLGGWQPCLTAEGITEEAIKNINEFFCAHPDATSFSLAVNDSGGDCECATCQSRDTGENNHLGVRDVSDRYFEWCNQVVTEVLKSHPDKYFGCLAYYQVGMPPTEVELHERLVPCLTQDRMRWFDQSLKKRGHELTESWAKASPTLGFYEYLYGTPYMLPRIYFRQMAENYRYANQQGVRVHYAEVYPNWGEGPKLYLALKLQWNPDEDIDKLLDDWYTACVGKEAAPLLAEYYELWEEFWTSSELANGEWFTSSNREYLNFYSPEYMELVSEDIIQRSRELLELTVGKTKTSKQKKRAELMLEAFEYYEASAYSYLASQKHLKTISNEEEALEFIAITLKGGAMAEQRQTLLAKFGDHPVLVHPRPISIKQHERLRCEAWGVGSLWPVYPWLDKSDHVRNKLNEVSATGWNVRAAQAKNILTKWSAQQEQ
ncbi:DUF4838 domain-containing protein [Adhaeretor mobilis]|uniref:DUF4838 domain-containing protein n=1 Tax=Adhaeretor mobilis TaxID=1930276 RepID=A0A517MW28_9BACT|nr:DUF4838 domain-containing protein [Adhaeretor mobilis]QDS99085.1 hypothetical protein HG15A2_23750 [Adhaeretor mobilis]